MLGHSIVLLTKLVKLVQHFHLFFFIIFVLRFCVNGISFGRHASTESYVCRKMNSMQPIFAVLYICQKVNYRCMPRRVHLAFLLYMTMIFGHSIFSNIYLILIIFLYLSFYYIIILFIIFIFFNIYIYIYIFIFLKMLFNT